MASIYVIAGVNGAGKSSILGEALLAAGSEFFNPDLAAQRLIHDNPGMPLEKANGLAWQLGFDGLVRALESGGTYAFESTLGASTITKTLIEGAKYGAMIELHYTGLNSPERHMARVAARVKKGGHDIPEEKIRQRYESSRENLIRLVPAITNLFLYDNSTDSDPELTPPEPVLILQVENRKLVYALKPESVPQWAKAAYVAVHKAYPVLYGLSGDETLGHRS